MKRFQSVVSTLLVLAILSSVTTGGPSVTDTEPVAQFSVVAESTGEYLTSGPFFVSLVGGLIGVALYNLLKWVYNNCRPTIMPHIYICWD